MKLESMTKIVGPPGTGKTHTLIETVRYYIDEQGILPERVCYLAFTVKAAKEARDRVMRDLNLVSDEMPYFRTLHSLVFRELGLKRADVMSLPDYVKLANMLGLFISFGALPEDGIYQGYSLGDRLVFADNMVRATNITVEEISDEKSLDPLELRNFMQTFAAFKMSHAKIDFTDMLQEFIAVEPKLPIDVLIVDEAQDLSTVQWDVVSYLSDHAQVTFVAGDDDQAIFRWAGADVDKFIDLPCLTRVLPVSYRVPIKVQGLADQIAGMISKRTPKQWTARAHEGELQYITTLDELDMSEGTWLLLARNTAFLKQYEEHCMSVGLMFDMKNSTLDKDIYHAIRYWEILRQGRSIRAEDVASMYEYMSVRNRVKKGFKLAVQKEESRRLLNLETLKKEFGLVSVAADPWHKALDRVPDTEREYYLQMLQKEELCKEPRIKISTIHSVKGGEADNVVLITDMVPKTYEGYQENPDDEFRVWYVAVTRTKDKLFVLTPSTRRSFEHILS